MMVYDYPMRTAQTHMVMKLTDPRLQALRKLMIFAENMRDQADGIMKRDYPDHPSNSDEVLARKKREHLLGLAAAWFEKEERND